MNIEKRLAEIKARRAEIRTSIENDTEGKLDLEPLEKELRELNAEESNLERRRTIEGLFNGGGAPGMGGGTPAGGTENPLQRREEDTEKLYRSAWLKNLQGKPLDEAEKRAFSTAANSALPAIPESTANQIIKRMYEVAPILERCRIFHIPGNMKFPVEGEGSDAELHTENAAISAGTDALAAVNLTGYEIVKLIKVSRAASAMTINAFESYIIDVVGSYVARRIERYIFGGKGVNEPGGVVTAGKGASGAYTDGTDQISVEAEGSLTEANVVALYGMLGNGYERNAVWAMRKATFFTDFYPLMNKSKNNVIEFAGGKYYIMGVEVYFTASVPEHEAYLGDYSYIIGNFSQDITVVKSEHSGLSTNSIDYLGACVFDSKPAAGLGAFVHLAKKAE